LIVLCCSIVLLNIGLDIGLLHFIISRILGENQPEILSAEIQPKKIRLAESQPEMSVSQP
jgi:hypothetical protein